MKRKKREGKRKKREGKRKRKRKRLGGKKTKSGRTNSNPNGNHHFHLVGRNTVN